jgi:two-component system LytT family response regulator
VTLRVLIADDEAVARRRLRRLLLPEPDVAIASECTDGASTLRSITTLGPDLVFLDVQMPELDGFEVVARLSEPGGQAARVPAIIFVTAFDRYALRAFDVHAIDYLLKPFSAERLRAALDRARERLRRRGPDVGLAGLADDLRRRRTFLTRVLCRSRGRTRVVPIESIDWIQAADNYVTLHVDRAEHLVREPLSAIEQQLDPLRFTRIHRSTLVNLDRIVEVRSSTHGDGVVVLRDGTRLTLSRTWRARVARALGAPTDPVG